MEVLKEISQIEQQLNNSQKSETLPEFVTGEGLRYLKREIYATFAAPFLGTFLKTNLMTFHIPSINHMASELTQAINVIVQDRSDKSLQVAKLLVDAATSAISDFSSSTVNGDWAKACVLLKAVQLFEKVWPQTSLVNCVCKTVFDDFAAKMIENDEDSWHDKGNKLKAVLVMVSQLKIWQLDDFKRRLVYRYSLLPNQLQAEVTNFFSN